MDLQTARERLFRTAPDAFVATRKALAAELKGAGHKQEAATFAKTPRPAVSVWAVNQLWWEERGPFEAMLQAAAQVRAGDLTQVAAHRQAIAGLVKRAAARLEAIGNAAQDSTLRRVETTLSAISASGFPPDEPGMLTEDREAAGFSALGISSVGPAAPVESAAAPEEAPRATVTDLAQVRAAKEEARAREEEARAQEERARAARARHEVALKEARARVEALRARSDELEQVLAQALAELNLAEEAVAELEARGPS